MSEAVPDVVLAVRGLAVSAGGTPLLDGFDLTLRTGEIVGLVAPSGAGKTTLLRSVTQLIDPIAGDVLLRGRRPGEIGWPRFRRQVVLVEQQPVLLPGSVATNLRRPFDYSSAGEPFPEERATLLLERVGVGAARLAQDAGSLSVGQQQRVALVRALLLAPLVLLLDEPTSALDVEAARGVERLLRDAAADGCAILIVTHDTAQGERLCDRIVELPTAEGVVRA